MVGRDLPVLHQRQTGRVPEGGFAAPAVGDRSLSEGGSPATYGNEKECRPEVCGPIPTRLSLRRLAPASAPDTEADQANNGTPEPAESIGRKCP